MNNTMQNTAINTMNGALRARQGAWLNRFATAGVAIVCALTTQLAAAQDTVCASVKIRIKQELTLERQAFEADGVNRVPSHLIHRTDYGVTDQLRGQVSQLAKHRFK